MEVVTFDNFGGGSPNLLKIDVEGAESRVLEGAARVLRNAKPTIILSVHGQEQREGCLARSCWPFTQCHRRSPDAGRSPQRSPYRETSQRRSPVRPHLGVPGDPDYLVSCPSSEVYELLRGYDQAAFSFEAAEPKPQRASHSSGLPSIRDGRRAPWRSVQPPGSGQGSDGSHQREDGVVQMGKTTQRPSQANSSDRLA